MAQSKADLPIRESLRPKGWTPRGHDKPKQAPKKKAAKKKSPPIQSDS